jgi:hypothetical protein
VRWRVETGISGTLPIVLDGARAGQGLAAIVLENGATATTARGPRRRRRRCRSPRGC